MKNSILIHTCCAPCFGKVFEELLPSCNVISFFYNPNIAPEFEYNKRLEELRRFSKVKDFEINIGEYDNKRWTTSIRGYRFLGERSERCWECYRIRLEGTFRFAQKKQISMVGTVLSISPHKDADVINSIGKELAQKYGIEFFEANFKKGSGYKKAMEISKKYGFYRQNYCGCIYSKMERGKNSLWYQKTRV